MELPTIQDHTQKLKNYVPDSSNIPSRNMPINRDNSL